MEKKTVFYIWGYGSSPDSQTIKNLKSLLNKKQYNVCSDFYAQYNPKEAIFDLNNLLEQYKPDVVVASSLGGYLALQLKGYKKIIINPCIRPDIELPKLNEKENTVPQHIIDYYMQYLKEHDVWEMFDNNEKENTVFVLGDKDELFGDKYKEEIEQHSSNVVISKQGHHNTKESLNDFVVPIIKTICE